MNKISNRSSTIITIVITALSLAGIFVLWLYSNAEAKKDLSSSLILLIILICISIGIFSILSRHIRMRQSELEKLIEQLVAELKTQKTRLEAAQTQTDQINRQLQLSVKYATTMSQQVIEAHKSKGEFLAGMSHHIRTPMNAIIGFSEVLAEDGLNTEQRRQVKIIRDSGKALLQLINDIFDFSKIESGRLELDASDVYVENTLSVVEAVMQPAAEEKNLHFEIIRHPSYECSNKCVRTDAARLKQCLINLVGNAVKFTQNGFIRITVSNQTRDDKPFIRFDVEDSGPGIAAENINTIFEPFSQIEGSDALMNHQFVSTGLGLAVTNRLAEMLGGKLSVQSIFSKGSTFSLFIPAPAIFQKYTAQESKIRQQIIGHLPALKKNENVRLKGIALVAEDCPTNQNLIELLLNRLGVKTEIVENGLKAVQKAAAEKFDVVLMDIQMPVMNGFEATRQIRKNNSELPIIALTACAMRGDDQKCFSAGCSEYLTKPIDKEKLIETLAKYLPSGPPNTVADETKNEQPASVQNDTAAENNSNRKQENSNMTTDETLAQSDEIELDWQLLNERIGSEDLIDEIMPVFLKDNTERIQLLAEAVKKRNSREVKFYAHSIKGASGTIGAAKIADVAKELESAARLEQVDKYAPLFEQIKLRFDRLLSLLSKKDWKQIAKDAAAAASA